MGTQPSYLPYVMPQSHAVDMPPVLRKDEIPSNQAMPTPNTVQLPEYQNLASSRSHLAPMSDQSVLNTSVSSTTKEVSQPYMFSNNVMSTPHSLQTSRPLGPQSQTIVSLAPQNTVTPSYNFCANQHTSTFLNQNAIHPTLTFPNTQQVKTPLSPTLLTHSISQPISAAVTAGSVRGPSLTTPQNAAASSTTLSMSAPLNYTPNISYASNPALSDQPALIARSGGDLNTIAAIDIGKPTNGTVIHSQIYASPFVPNKMHSNFARSIVPTSTISTLPKPVVVPTHQLTMVSLPVLYMLIFIFANILLY